MSERRDTDTDPALQKKQVTSCRVELNIAELSEKMCFYYQGWLNYCRYYLAINFSQDLRTNMRVNMFNLLFFLCVQRKSLDLNLPSATPPSRGKTLPTPVQVEFTHSRNYWELLKPAVNVSLSDCTTMFSRNLHVKIMFVIQRLLAHRFVHQIKMFHIYFNRGLGFCI